MAKHEWSVAEWPMDGAVDGCQLVIVAGNGHGIAGMKQRGRGKGVREQADLLASAPELARRLDEALDLLSGTAGWLGLPADKQPDHAQVAAAIREWAVKNGQPALDKAYGK